MGKLRLRRLLAWAFFWSVVIHFTFGPLMVWLFGVHLRPMETQPKEQIFTIARSSAMKLEHRTVPAATRTPIKTPRIPVAQPQRPVPVQRPHRPQRPSSQKVRQELASAHSRSPIVVPKLAQQGARQSSSEDKFAEQERMFSRTIERLRQENDPVLSAERPVRVPQTMRRYASNFSASVGATYAGEGILYPQKSWRDGGFIYYYVSYYVEYPDGTTETGYVPWPLRYLPGMDPFRLGLRRIPLPGPLPDFVLSSDTNLHPLVAFCYEHRFSGSVAHEGCPIAHD